MYREESYPRRRGTRSPLITLPRVRGSVQAMKCATATNTSEGADEDRTPPLAPVGGPLEHLRPMGPRSFSITSQDLVRCRSGQTSGGLRRRKWVRCGLHITRTAHYPFLISNTSLDVPAGPRDPWASSHPTRDVVRRASVEGCSRSSLAQEKQEKGCRGHWAPWARMHPHSHGLDALTRRALEVQRLVITIPDDAAAGARAVLEGSR